MQDVKTRSYLLRTCMELDSSSQVNDPDDAWYIGALVGRDNSNV